MKEQNENKSDAAKLRQRAEKQLKKQQSKVGSLSSENDIRKINFELQVHQIELEMQNKELMFAKTESDAAAKKYTELFDFAPSGYFTLTKEGEITELNIHGASLLGKERQKLINARFGFFITEDTKQIFNLFLDKVFEGKGKESCEVTLSVESKNSPTYVYVTGHVAENGEQCQISVVDITERKLREELSQNNAALNKINQFALELTNLSSNDNLEAFITKQIKKIANAEVAIFSEYNSANQTITPKHIEAGSGLLKKAHSLLGTKAQDTQTVVSDEMYQEWSTNLIAVWETLYDASFGEIPRSVGAAIKALLKADRFISLSFFIEGKLYGSGLLAMEKEQPDPPKEILENFIHLASVSLRRKQTDKALKESEDKLQDNLKVLNEVTQNMFDTVAFFSNEGEILYATPSYKRVFGYMPQIGEDLMEYVHPDDIENVLATITKFKETQVPQTHELRLRNADGNYIWAESISNVYKNNEGEIAGMISSTRDITERKNAEEKLKEFQLLLSSTIDSQKDTIIFSIDKNYNYLIFNKAHENAMKFAWNVDVKLGMNILDCINSDDERLMAKKNYDRALKGESHSNIQIFGSINPAYYESFFNPIRDDNNEIIACAGLARNITQRMQTEENLKKRESELKERIKELNGLYELTLLTDRYSNLEDIYYEFVNLVTPKSMQFPDKTVVLLEIKDKKYCNIDDFSLEKNKSYLTAPIIVFGKEIGELIVTYTEDLPFIDLFEQNLINEYAGRISKITERIDARIAIEESEKKLVKLNADKDRFIQILAHDLKSPFNSLLGFSELLAKNSHKYDVDKIELLAANINKSAQNSYNLLDDLLVWARSQQGSIPIEPQNLRLTDVCNEVLKTLNPTANAKHIGINCLAEDTMNVFADANMLKTVLRNLVSNAIKFSNKNGSVNISAEKNPEKVTIRVSDNGIGIPLKNLEKLFDISETLSTKGTSGELGTGLGLLLCKEFVEKHGGRIWAESEAGKGSEFIFTLPTK